MKKDSFSTSYHWAMSNGASMIWLMFSAIFILPRNYTCKIFAWIILLFYHCCNIINITSLSSPVLSTSDCKCEGSRFESHQKFYMCLLDVCLYINHVCLLVLYNGLWLSGLGCLFLLQKYWSMMKVVGSSPATCSYSSTFLLSIQIRNFPTPLPYYLYVQLPHLGKKCCTT